MLDLALVSAVDAENPTEGDLRITSAQLATVSGREAIAQDLAVCLAWFREEWFLDTRRGLPWLQSVIGVRTSDAIVSAIIRRAILQRPGVASLESLTVETDNPERGIVIGYVVRTVDGEEIEQRPFVLGELER